MRKSKQLLATAAVLMCAAAVTPVRAQGAPGDAMPVPPPEMGGPGADIVFTMEAPIPLMGGIEDGDMLEQSMVPSAELFLASLPEEGGATFIAQGPGGGRGHGMFPKELAITDDQWEKLYQVGKDFNAKAAPKMFEMRQQMTALKDTLTEVDVDRTKAAAIQGRINGLQAELANMKLDKKISMMGVLTPEQRKELHSRFLKMSVMHDFMGGRPGGMRMRHHHGGKMGKGGHGAPCGPGGAPCGPGGPGGPGSGPGGPGGPPR